VEDNPTRVCGLIVGLSDVDVLGVVDAPGVDMSAALANLETLFKESRQG